MPDLRAEILDRLEELLPSIPGAPATTVFRNKGSFPEEARPCMILLDGRETTHESYEGKAGRVYARTGPYIMRLDPQIFAVLRKRIPDKSDEYAPEINAYRNAIIRGILEDPILTELTGDNGDIVYRGMVTDMESGRTMFGELQMQFSFFYHLNPSSL